MGTALYPGTFDPPTNGHLSLIRRGCQLFDRIIVAVADRTPKPARFSQEERCAMLAEALADNPQVEVAPFSGLTVAYAQERGVSAVLRGMRAVSDFEMEFQLALMNRRLNRRIETVFLMTDYQWLYISSTMVKGAAAHGASIEGLVPPGVARRLQVTGAGEAGPGEGTACALPVPRSHTVVYPGTFDPVTNGHVSIIRRALRFFDKVVVAVAENAGKNPLFSLEERVAFVRDATAHLKRVEVIPYSGLTVQFAAAHGACAMLRGLRATGDFEYEFQLALMNRRLQNDMQTVFLMTDYRWLFVSSSIVKAAASHGGDIAGLVPDLVRARLEELYRTGGMNQSTPCLGAPQAGYGRKPGGGS